MIFIIEFFLILFSVISFFAYKNSKDYIQRTIAGAFLDHLVIISFFFIPMTLLFNKRSSYVCLVLFGIVTGVFLAFNIMTASYEVKAYRQNKKSAAKRR